MRHAWSIKSMNPNKEISQMLTLYSCCKNAITMLKRRLLKDQKGQTMVEYVMLIVLVALAVFMLTPNIKSAILTVFSNTSSALATGSAS